jgi:hypothetical protein
MRVLEAANATADGDIVSRQVTIEPGVWLQPIKSSMGVGVLKGLGAWL